MYTVLVGVFCIYGRYQLNHLINLFLPLYRRPTVFFMLSSVTCAFLLYTDGYSVKVGECCGVRLQLMITVMITLLKPDYN